MRSQLWRSMSSGSLRRETPRHLDALWHRGLGLVRSLRSTPARFLSEAQRIVALERRIASLSDSALRARAGELRDRFRTLRESPSDLPETFALVREAAHRTLGMRHHPAQIAGGLAMAHGAIAEMATGEGKTLSATLPATVAAWRGRGCHIVTVNDYLARRDALWMSPLYTMLGVSVGIVESQTPARERRSAYAADLTYTTNKEVAADFLRDRLRLGGVRSLASALAMDLGASGRLDSLLMRGLACAIVDEADSVLIDEAVTPLIIAGEGDDAARNSAHVLASEIARDLELDRHFTADRRYREIRLTSDGAHVVRERTRDAGGVWSGPRRAEELIVQALTARLFYLREKHYVVQQGKAMIVDDFTGRLMPDRTWRDGLHQAIEAKEGLELTSPKHTLARISFQRFFRLYSRLAGMSGTASEESGEFWSVYALPVVVVPTHKPRARRELPDRVFRRADDKWVAAADEVERTRREGRAVLVGARTVAQSERLSELLRERGVEHHVLSATRHEEEARIVAQAGQTGRVTIATNMAGRGTDIRLDPGVAERGGLHVICMERHESRRVDRQLFGRAGRQGDPGSARCIISLQDELVERFAPVAVRRLGSSSLGQGRGEVPAALASGLFASAQDAAQKLARQQRASVLRSDDWLDDALGFAGVGV